MKERGLVRRSATPATTRVEATPAGRERVVTAREVHVAAVREVLLSRIDHGNPDDFWQALEVLGRPAAP
jgi:hypothetical protein